MTHAHRSFFLSLIFHSLMGSLAFWFLTQISTPPHITRIPFKIMSFQPTEHRVAVPLPKTVPLQETQPLSKVVPTPVSPVSKPAISQTLPPAPIQTSAPVAQAIPKTIITPQPVSAPIPVSVSKPEAKPDNTSEKKAFLAALRSTIQHNLRYPNTARRRGMEGEVNVRFVLENSGTVREINIRQGEAIFHNAAKLAVASVSGVKVPDTLSGTFPAEIELMLEFRLNESL